MSELPGLPAFGAEPVFAGTDAAYDTVVGRALARRRRKATTTASATALAALALVALYQGGAAGHTSLRPARSPAPTRRPVPSPSGTYVPGVPIPSRPPATGVPTASPRSSGPRPAASTAPARAAEHWSAVTTTVVPDSSPGQRCERNNDPDGWCFRYTGPTSARSGAPVTFTAELCRFAGGTSASRVDFDSADEVLVTLQGHVDADHDYTSDNMAHSSHGLPKRAHSREVAVGSCLHWAVTWNGVDDHGEPLPVEPRSYRLLMDVSGTAPRQPLPGDGNQQTVSFWLFEGSFAILA